MKLFKRKPSYFDFSWHRKQRVVILRDFISAIVLGIGEFLAPYIGAVVGYGATALEIGMGIGYAAVTAASYAVSALLSSLTTKSGKQTTMSLGGLQVTSQNPTDPVRLAYGEQRLAPVRVFAATNRTALNLWLHMILEWGEGPWEGPKTDGEDVMMYLDDQRLQTYKVGSINCFYHEFYNGGLNQMPSSELHAAFPDWYDAHRGTAYSYLRLRYVESLFTSVPNITCVMRCRKLFDHRTGLIAYSNNPALVRFDYMTHPRAGGIPGSLLNKQSIIDAANWYDSHGYEFNGCIIDRQEFLSNLEQLELSCKAETIWTGSEYKMIIHSYDSAVMPLDERDIQIAEGANSLGVTDVNIAEVPTRLCAWFADKNDNWRVKAAYWPQAAKEVAEDRPDKEVSLIGVDDYGLALKIAKYLYLRSKYSKTFDFVANPGGPVGEVVAQTRIIALQNCDMIEVSHNPDLPLTSIPSTWDRKIFRVKDCPITQSNRPALILMEEAEEIYDETVDTTTHYSYVPATSDIVIQPTNLLATTGEDTSTARIDDAYIDFQFDNVGADKYQIRYRKLGKTIWTTIPAFQNPGGEVDPPVKTGTGTLTMESAGNFTGDSARNYRVQIDGVGSPDTFKWSDTGGAIWNATGVAITADWQELNEGVKIRFNATTGGVSGDRYDFHTKLNSPIIHRLGGLPVNTEYEWQVCAITGAKTSEWASPSSTIITWNTSAPTVPGVTITATGKTTLILISWTDPTDREYEIDRWVLYRNTVNDSSTSLQLDDKGRGTHSYRDNKNLPGQTFVDGSTYYYWIKIKNKSGQLSDFIGPASAASIAVEGADPNPPSVLPSSLSLSMTRWEVNAAYYDEWTATFLGSTDDEGNLAGYQVQLWNLTDNVKAGFMIDEPAGANDETGTTKTVYGKGLYRVKKANGTLINWAFKVRAYDRRKNYTNWVTSSGTNDAGAGPAAPTWPLVGAIKKSGLSITVKINANTESDLGGYEYHFSQTGGFTPDDSTLVKTGTKGTSFTWVAPNAGTWYCKIIAYDSELPTPNKSSPSAQKSITVADSVGDDTTAPTPNPVAGPDGVGDPIDVTTESYWIGRIEKCRATLTWGICTDDSGKNPRYDVTIWSDSTTKTTHHPVRQPASGTTQHFTINNLEPDTQYYAYVIAYDYQNNATDPQISPISILTTHDASAPVMTNVHLTATGKIKLVLLNWHYDSGTQEADFKEWIIYRNTSNNSGTAVEIDRKSRQSRSYRDTSIPADQTLYYYWLKGVDEAGNVSTTFCAVASASSTGVLADDTTPPTPDPPTGMASTVTLQYAGQLTRMQVHLTWDVCTDASGKAVKYEVHWWKTGESAKPSKATTLAAAVTIRNLDPSTTYYWKVASYDWQKNYTSFCADQTISVTDDVTAPADPTVNSTIKGIGGVLFFSWTRNTETDASEYRLYVYTSNNPASAVILKRMPHQTTNTSVNVGKTAESGGITLTAGTAYYFWLTCADRAGNESGETYINSITPRKGYYKSATAALVDEDDVQATVDQIADGSTRKAVTAIDASGRAIIDLAQAHYNKILDNIADSVNYAKTIASRISSGKPLIDFSEAIHLNKNLDNVPDGTRKAVGSKNISGVNIADYAVTAAAYYENNNAINYQAETEIGTITIYANTDTDTVLLWARCAVVTDPPGTGKSTITGTKIRIRKTSLSGAIIDEWHTQSYFSATPLNLLVSVVPGAVGNAVYKLSAIADSDATGPGAVAYRRIRAFRKTV